MKNRKYGPVIFDASTDEAYKLIGKEVIGSNCYDKIARRPEKAWESVLREMDPYHSHPFELTDDISSGLSERHWYERR